MSEESCVSLTRALRRGDEEAWTHFHERYYSFILGASRSLARDHFTAQDLTQLCLLRMVKHMKIFQSDQDLENWMRCIIRCVYIDYVRGSGRRASLLEKFKHWYELRQPDPFAIAIQSDRLERLLAPLPVTDRQLVTAFYLEHQSQSEIAKTLGTTRRAIESRLSRIRQTLRQS